MRVITAVLLLFFLTISCDPTQQKQGVAKFYSDEFSINGTSSDVLQLMINEYKSSDSTHTKDLAKQILSNAGIVNFDAESLEAYTKDYQKALYQANFSNADAAFFTSISDDLAKKNVAVFSNFSSTKLTQDINHLLPIVLEKAFRQSIDSIARDVMVEEISLEVNKYIEDRISLFYQKGVNLFDKRQEEFEKKFSSRLDDLTEIKQDSVFGILLPSVAFKHLKKIKSTYKHIELTQAELESKAKQLNKKAIHLTERTGDLVRKQMNEIDSSLTKLVKNEKKAIELSEKIYKKAVILSKKADSVHVLLRKELLKTKRGKEISKLQSDLQRDYYHYSKAAYVLTNIISDYQKGKLDSRAVLKSIDNKYINSVLNIEGAYNDIKQSIKDLAEVNLQTISTVSMRVCSNMEVAAAELESLKVIKGKDAKNVGKFIKYLSSSIQIATGVGKTFGGDPSGVFNIISGLSGLFGGSSAPSPEIQMMSYMGNRFDAIDDQLQGINTKLDSLTSLTINLYKDVITNFQMVHNELALIKDDLADIKKMEQLDLYKEYFSCVSNFKNDKSRYNTYSDFIRQHNHLGKCLDGLDNISSPQAKANYFLITLNTGNEKITDILTFQNSVYIPLVNYFNTKYLSNDAKITAVNASLFPSYEFSWIKPAEIVSNYQVSLLDDDILDIVMGNKTYINYNFLYEFVQTYLRYSSYFEIHSNTTDFKPHSINEYMSLSNDLKLQALKNNIDRLLHLYNLVKYALIQQSLLSGNELVLTILSTITTANKPSNKQNAIECLKYNPVLNQNYSKLLLRDQVLFMNGDSTLFEAYSSIFLHQSKQDEKEMNQAIKEFNEILNRRGKNKYLSLDYNKKDAIITLKLKSPGIADSAIAKAPYPEDLLDRKFMQNEGVYKMLEIQEKLRIKLINSYFNSSLVKNSSSKSQQVFKALYTIDSIQSNSSKVNK